ncbi:hypothetical protein EMCRGX_G011566 [Ephydatia muelleri]
MGMTSSNLFGFPIHACIDGFSWKIIWLELTATNNDPDVVVKFYLDAVVKLEESSDGRGHSLSEEAGHLKSHVRELREATASLERSHDLETRLLKGNRTLQEQSVESQLTAEQSKKMCARADQVVDMKASKSCLEKHSLVPRPLCWRRL